VSVRLLTGPLSDQGASERSDLSTTDLLALYAVDERAPVVRANMVVSLDGRATDADGLSAGISSEADRFVFSLLRSQSDAIIVGAGTARAEGYKPAKVRREFALSREARGRFDPPIIAVVSRSLRFDASDPLYTRGRTLIITSEGADGDAVARAEESVEVIRTPGADVDLAAAAPALRSRGMAHLLIEGGPHLFTDALAQDVIDELCLTIAPVIVGGDGPRLLATHEAIQSRFSLQHIVESEGFLMTRYRRSRS
jgi:riboflavin-specific deaminase-like protein